jgi:heptosyltransferase-2
MSARQTAAARRLLVVIPNWVGDVVLATPVLAALRGFFRDARITYLLRSYVSEVVAGGAWHDDEVHWPARRGLPALAGLGRRLRAERFDLALLLTNSFRSAAVVRLAGARRRVGYARDGRGWMLTDGLQPPRRDGEFVPTPVLPYYAALAEHVGCEVPDRKLRLGITPAQEQAGQELRRHYGLDDGRPYALVNAGAAFGASKCWPAERFGEVCDRLRAEHGLTPVLVGAPHEAALLRTIAMYAKHGVVCCDEPATTLGSLKVLARGAALLVCNDTGPRHYGAAFNVPTVTIFGPTHQAWTDTDYQREIKLQIPVECGPCQRPVCPLDHRCMTGLTVAMVMRAAAAVLARSAVGA